MSTQSIAKLSADAGLLIAQISKLSPGDIVRYDWIKTLIGWDIRDNRGIMSTVKRRLLRDYNLVLGQAIPGGGYPILTHEQIAKGELRRDRERRRRHARRSIEKGATVELSALDGQARTTLIAEITIANMQVESATEKSINQVRLSLNGATQPLALNHALDAIKRNLTEKPTDAKSTQ